MPWMTRSTDSFKSSDARSSPARSTSAACGGYAAACVEDCLLVPDEDRVLADSDGNLQFTVHGAPIVAWLTVNRHLAVLRIDIADPERRPLPGCARSSGVGGDDEAPAVDVVPGLREADGGKVNAVDRGINELAQVGLVDHPPPCAFAPSFRDHHHGVVLTAWM